MIYLVEVPKLLSYKNFALRVKKPEYTIFPNVVLIAADEVETVGMLIWLEYVAQTIQGLPCSY